MNILEWKYLNWYIVHGCLANNNNNKSISTGSDYGLVRNRPRIIIWIDDLICMRTYMRHPVPMRQLRMWRWWSCMNIYFFPSHAWSNTYGGYIFNSSKPVEKQCKIPENCTCRQPYKIKCRYNPVQFSRYYIRHCDNRGRKYIRY